jgi:hypothetical protein
MTMPCDSVQTTTVEFMKVNLHRLASTLALAGWAVTEHPDNVYAFMQGVTFNLQRGASEADVTISRYASVNSDDVVGQIKRLYAAQTAKDITKKFGWQLKSTDKTGTKMIFGRK